MARLRARTRHRTARRNPLKPIGALLINPRKAHKRRNPPTGMLWSAKFPVLVKASSGAKPQRKYRRRPASHRGRRAVVAFNYHTKPPRPIVHRKTRKARKNGSARKFSLKGLRRRVARKSRRNPVRRLVARRRARRSVRRNPLFLRTNGKRRRVRKHRAAARRPVAHRRRRSRRNPLFLRTNPLFLRTNGSKRRKSHSRRRRTRRNGLALFRRNGSGMLAKIPVIGPTLAAASTFLMPGAFGAVSVEPVMFVAQMAAPYLPAAMPFSLTILGTGVLVAALVKKFGPFKPETNTALAIAAASGSGAIAYWTWRNGDDAPVKEKMGALIVAGYGSPIAGAIMGNANLGGLIAESGYGHFGTPGFASNTSAPVPTMGWSAAGSSFV